MEQHADQRGGADIVRRGAQVSRHIAATSKNPALTMT